MTTLLEGVKIGLLLSILAGPLLFALLQAGIERGARGGLASHSVSGPATGFLSQPWSGVSLFHALSAQPEFRFWITLLGAFTLGGGGVSMLLSKKSPRA